jgi:hypothetical protein
MTPILDPYGDLFALLEMPKDGELMRAIRKKLAWAYSYAVPSREVLAELVTHGPLIEVGAGTGYWAWLLTQLGVDIVAFDRNAAAPPHWHPVASGGAVALDAHPQRTLFLCWPPLDEPLAQQCLERYQGDVFLHIGETGVSARTGSQTFRQLLAREWELVREVPLPRWPGFHDSLTVWRREPGGNA